MNTAVSAILFLALAAASAPLDAKGPRSVYTEISERSCKLIPASDEPGDEDGLRCRGPAGYELLALSGDLRATVTVVAPDGSEHALEFWNVVTGSFSTLGARAEWRVRETDGLPQALIVRVYASEDPDRPDRRTSYLAVARISAEATCVTDRIAAGQGDNERARSAADAAPTRACLPNIR